MKYNINLNLLKMQEHGLNVNQWCILDIISTASTWCEIFTYKENHYYWISKNKICEELKALDLKVDTVYRHLKLLSELGFINYVKDGKKDLVILTEIGKSLFFKDDNSEINPTKLGNKSELNSEINPTYNNTNINNNTNDTKKNKKEQLITILKEKDLTGINKKSLHEWLEYKEWNYKEIGINKIIGLLKQYSFLEQEEIVNKSIISNYKGLFALNKNISNNQPQEQFQSKAEKTKAFIEDYYKRKAEATQSSNADIIDGEVMS